MKARQALGAACGLLATLVVVATAQSANQKTNDQISGQWGQNGLPYLDLKFDGEKTLSGTVYWRHDSDVQQSAIKTGTFDPKTSAFKIEGEAPWPPSGPPAKYLIEGKVEEDTISGTYSIGDNNGQFNFTRLHSGQH
jgi:hypothetical protein